MLNLKFSKNTAWKIFCTLIIIILTTVDRITKHLIISNIGYGDRIVIIKDFLNITYHRNFGAAWGILQGALPFFIVVSIVMAIILAIIIIKSGSKLLDFSVVLILSGAIGNFIDRLSGEGVTDFLEFFIFRYDFPIFNAADTFITCGTIIFAVYLLFFQKDKDISWSLLKKN